MVLLPTRQTYLPLALLSGQWWLYLSHTSVFQTMMMMKLLMKVALTMMPARQLWEWGRLLPWKNWVKRTREELSSSPCALMKILKVALQPRTLWRLQNWTSCGHLTPMTTGASGTAHVHSGSVYHNTLMHLLWWSIIIRRKWPILGP